MIPSNPYPRENYDPHEEEDYRDFADGSGLLPNLYKAITVGLAIAIGLVIGGVMLVSKHWNVIQNYLK